MKTKMMVCLITLLGTTNCGIFKGSSSKKGNNPLAFKDQNLSGTVDGNEWQFKSGVAKLEKDEYQIYLYSEELASPCLQNNLSSKEDYVMFKYPVDAEGIDLTFDGDNARTATIVEKNDGTLVTNWIISDGRVELAKPERNTISGRGIFYFDGKTNLNGNFTVTFCVDGKTKQSSRDVLLGVEVHELSSFDPVDMDVLKDFSGIYIDEANGDYYVAGPEASRNYSSSNEQGFAVYKFDSMNLSFSNATETTWVNFDRTNKIFAGKFSKRIYHRANTSYPGLSAAAANILKKADRLLKTMFEVQQELNESDLIVDLSLNANEEVEQKMDNVIAKLDVIKEHIANARYLIQERGIETLEVALDGYCYAIVDNNTLCISAHKSQTLEMIHNLLN